MFGFFISGPGITGPYSAPAAFPNGSVNIATVPNSTPALPITISSVNDVLNNQYYIDNQKILIRKQFCVMDLQLFLQLRRRSSVAKHITSD